MKMLSIERSHRPFQQSFVFEINSNSSEASNDKLAMASSHIINATSVDQSQFKYWNPATIDEKIGNSTAINQTVSLMIGE